MKFNSFSTTGKIAGEKDKVCWQSRRYFDENLNLHAYNKTNCTNESLKCLLFYEEE